MKNEELIGRKFRGFSFEDGKHNDLQYNEHMNQLIGVDMVITEIDESDESVYCCGDWFYPLELVKKHLIPEDKPEIKWVWVRDIDHEEWMKYILITDLGENFTNRYIVVGSGEESRYKMGDKDIRITVFKQISYTDPNPNEEIEKEIKELEGKINVLKQKLCK